MKKRRIDLVLVERGFFETREKAQRALFAGEVFVGADRVTKAAHPLSSDDEEKITLTVKDHAVSRGYYKLKKAFEVFDLAARARTALDIGSSTGGFTQYLLESGAAFVYAVDCGTNQLAYPLRRCERVVVMEKTNARFLLRRDLEEAARKKRISNFTPPDLCVMDVSFISVGLILPQLVREFPLREFVLLVKPQFEAGRAEVERGGIVRDASAHRAVLARIAAFARELGFPMRGLDYSPIKGSGGNIEFLALLRREGQDIGSERIDALVAEAHERL